MMNICKKSKPKFPLFRELLRFEVFYCSLLLFYCLIHINEQLMKASSISKMDTIFGFLVPKDVINVKFDRSDIIISKVMGPSFLHISVLKGTPVQNMTRVTSFGSKFENSNMNNSRNNENLDLLFF